ncbi:hematopoietic SH2 domain-containing protein homolog isoform X2 [Lepisosteus oculatus]
MYKPVGCFLIRVSESRIGYTLSCRADDRCRHYMIDVLRNGQYIIVGENTSHRSLQDLVDFYRRIPLMPHNELLLSTCGQAPNASADYAELLHGWGNIPGSPSAGMRPSTSPSNLPHSDSLAKRRSPMDGLPPLPNHCPVPAAGELSQAKPSAPFSSPLPAASLYPCLPTELAAMSLSTDIATEVMPIPLPRKKKTQKSAPSVELPTELPSQTFLPQTQVQTSSGPVQTQPSTLICTETPLTRSNPCFGVPSCELASTEKGGLANPPKDPPRKKSLEEHTYEEPFQHASAGSVAEPPVRRDASARRDTEGDSAEERNIYEEIWQEKKEQKACPATTSSSPRATKTMVFSPDDPVYGSGTLVSVHNEQPGVPVEYLHPPPFAPGY